MTWSPKHPATRGGILNAGDAPDPTNLWKVYREFTLLYKELGGAATAPS